MSLLSTCGALPCYKVTKQNLRVATELSFCNFGPNLEKIACLLSKSGFKENFMYTTFAQLWCPIMLQSFKKIL